MSSKPTSFSLWTDIISTVTKDPHNCGIGALDESKPFGMKMLAGSAGRFSFVRHISIRMNPCNIVVEVGEGEHMDFHEAPFAIAEFPLSEHICLGFTDMHSWEIDLEDVSICN